MEHMKALHLVLIPHHDAVGSVNSNKGTINTVNVLRQEYVMATGPVGNQILSCPNILLYGLCSYSLAYDKASIYIWYHNCTNLKLLHKC